MIAVRCAPCPLLAGWSFMAALYLLTGQTGEADGQLMLIVQRIARQGGAS